MKFIVLFIGSLLLLGIVFAGIVDCKSDKANSAAPGQKAIKPGNAEGHSGAPGQTGANPGQEKKTGDNLVESSSQSTSYQGLASLENWLNQPTNYFPWYSSDGSTFYSQGYSESTFSAFRYACSGRDNQHPYQVRYCAENAYYDILRRRPGLAILPVCVLNAIQYQRPLGPGSNKLVPVCGKPGWNLAAAGCQCTRWRVSRRL